MFRRSESLRERTLLRLVESLQQQNRDLTDRLMYATGNVWMPPPEQANVHKTEPEERDWTATPEQEPVF